MIRLYPLIASKANKIVVNIFFGFSCLIQTVMAETAVQWKIFPRDVSFKATIQLLNAFRVRGLLNNEIRTRGIVEELFRATARNRVNDHPGRMEPHVV